VQSRNSLTYLLRNYTIAKLRNFLHMHADECVGERAGVHAGECVGELAGEHV
jgi:hypothetical protein